MGVDGLPDALDATVVVHGRHCLMEQVVTVRSEDVKSQNFAIGLIHHGLEPAAAITDRQGPGTLGADAPHRHVVALLTRLGLRQTDSGERRIAEDDARDHAIVDASRYPLDRIESGLANCAQRLPR